MNIDGVFISSDITTENIAKISKDQSLLEERRICEISELAREAADYSSEMLADGYGVYEVLSLVSEGFLKSGVNFHERALPENENRLKKHLWINLSQDKVAFSEIFREVLMARGIELSEKDFLPTDAVGESFTYVKNPLADEAYEVFSENFSKPTVRYSKTLAETARAVNLSEYQYALLPLEEKGGARIPATAELIFKEDLKINSVTPVFGFEGNADMKYALVAKSFFIPDIKADDDRYLEILLRADSSVSLSELLLAADIFGVKIYRANTISLDGEDGRAEYYSVVLKDEGKSFTSLLIYLTLFSGAYTPIGIYTNLE